MKKNILFLIESLRDGGSEKSISNIATQISKKHNVILVVADNKNKDYTFNGKIIEIKEFKSKNKLKRLVGIKKLKKIKKDNNIDISISYLTAYNLYNVLSKYKDKIYISIRNHLSTKKEGTIARISTIYSNKKADKIICCSNSVQTDQITNFKANYNKTIIIENYIEKQNIKDIKKDNTIITIGRLTKHKNQELIIKSMKRVIKKIPNAKLLILGRGKEKNYLEELIEKYKLNKNVRLIGFTNNVNEYLNKSKIFVLASQYEGFSNSILEAMSYSLPIIATNSPGGNSEILNDTEYSKNTKVIHGKYGILIPNNEGILSKEIINLLTNKKDYNYYKEKSLERSKHYNKATIVKKWLKIIEEE